MRLTKGMKKILSLALTGALVITGANITGGTKTAEAAGLPYGLVGEAGSDIDTPFDISITQNGSINGWGAVPTDDEAKINITKAGRYQLSATASSDVSDLSASGAIWLTTTLKAKPTTFGVVAEKLTVGNKDYEFNQEKARLFDDNGELKVGIGNQWGDDNTNTLKGTVSVSSGDVVTVTFKVFLGDPNGEIPADSAPAASADASAAPSADASAAPTDAPVAPASLPYGLVAGTEGAALKAPFTAYIQNNGNFNGWNGDPTNPESQIKIEKCGEYELSVVAAEDKDNMLKAGAVWLQTDLTGKPDGFNLVAETLTVDGDVYDFDQTLAQLYDDQGNIRVGIANEWNPNAWGTPFKADEEIPVDEGDVITVKFKVYEGATASFFDENDPAPSPSVAPSAAPTATNACTAVKAAKKTVTVKRGKTKTITFKLTNTNKSAVTTDKITVKSSNKKVTAKVTKTTATKVTVKVQVNKKAKKKSKAKITLKVGKKSAKTTIKVK